MCVPLEEHLKVNPVWTRVSKKCHSEFFPPPLITSQRDLALHVNLSSLSRQVPLTHFYNEN